MKSFLHFNARSVHEAVKLLKDYNGKAKLIAGGTDLLGVLKDGILPDYPEAIINIKTLSSLNYIKEDANGLKMGAVAKLEDIVRSSVIRTKYKVLAEAARAVATPQIRSMGTLGGNLVQDVRCWYYRYPHHVGGRMLCQRKGRGPCFAVRGDNRYHAILKGGTCFAVCPSDTAVALTALGARIKITGSKGSRSVPIMEFFTPLGKVLQPNEVITEIQVPRPPEGAKQTFLKFTLRKPIDFAIVSVALIIALKDGICNDARIALGGVAPTPVRAIEAEKVVLGSALDAAAVEAAAEAAVKGAKPLSLNGYKIEIAKAEVRRAFLS